MKTFFIFLLITALSITSLQGQVGFNNPNPHPNSLLDLTATDKGLLIPRLTTVQRDALTLVLNPAAESLLVYDTNLKGFYFFQGGSWYSLSGWVKAIGSNNVSLVGNANITGTMSVGAVSSSSITNSGTISSNNISNSGTISSANISNSGTISSANISNSGTISSTNLNVSGAVEILGGVRTENPGPFLKTRVIPIGDWNMDTQPQVVISSTFFSDDVVPRADKIRICSVLIISDFSFGFNIESLDRGGYFTISNYGSIILTRNNSGLFDNATYSTTNYNRGWITFVYEQ
jgi:hypothetical protein